MREREREREMRGGVGRGHVSLGATLDACIACVHYCCNIAAAKFRGLPKRRAGRARRELD